ncbi:MAG: phosphoenolpyruvate--protein phosphotransferase [Gammaproteobacteria bacterium]|nr:MAG: phosphoenolpyruvate--protein phosphotransferase [Gammaproteobacteria bacterium]
MALIVSGIGVSRGIAIGNVHLLNRGAPEVFERKLKEHEIDAEIERFQDAVDDAADQLRGIRDTIPEDAPKDVATFIDSHLLMVKDSMLRKVPIEIIQEQHCNAEWALKQQRDKLEAVFEQMEDDYLRTRLNDIEHVINLIQQILKDQQFTMQIKLQPLKGSIIVADDLTPADTVVMQNQNIAGFITELGGPLSHTAILARSLGIPAVVGIQSARTLLQREEQLVLDGSSGLVLAGINENTIKEFRQIQREQKDAQRKLGSLKNISAKTKDGKRISLQANIELAEDVSALKKSGADGVGLYRTEFLYIDRETPADESEQLNAYRKIIRVLKGKPLTIRTLDLGGDKEFDPNFQGPLTQNPALGLRAIRRSLKDTELFKQQLRAILRASASGPVRILLPMITSDTELVQSLSLLDQAKHELKDENKDFDAEILVGAMIEVPAAAISANIFAKQLDFLSIGTNDLIQYTLAIDRIDDQVNYLYDPLHPSVLKLINTTLQAGRRADIPVAMCGEMAGDPRYTRLLLGLGLEEFSAHPSTLLEIKQIINKSKISELEKQTKKILNTTVPSKIAPMVDALNE